MQQENLKENKSSSSQKNLGKNSFTVKESDIRWLQKLDNKFWQHDWNGKRYWSGKITEKEFRGLVTIISAYDLPVTIKKDKCLSIYNHESQYGLPPNELLCICPYSFAGIRCGKKFYSGCEELKTMVYLIEPILYSKRNLELLDWYDLPKPLEESYNYEYI